MKFNESNMENQYLTDSIDVDFGDTVVEFTYEELIASLLKSYDNESLEGKLEKVLNSLNENELRKLLQFLLDVNMSKCFVSLSDDVLENLNTKYPEIKIGLWKDLNGENSYNDTSFPKIMEYIKDEKIESELALERVAREVYRDNMILSLSWPHMKKINEELVGDSLEEIKVFENLLVTARFFNSDLSFAIKNGQKEEIEKLWKRVFKNVFIDSLKNTEEGPQNRLYMQGIPLLSGLTELITKNANDEELYELLKEGFHLLLNTYDDGRVTPGQESVIQMLVEILLINKNFYKEPAFIELSERYIKKQDNGILIMEDLLSVLYSSHKWNIPLIWGAEERWVIDSNSALGPKMILKIKDEVVQILKEAFPQSSEDIEIDNRLIKLPKELLESSLTDDIISTFKQLVENGCPEAIPSGIEAIVTQQMMKEDMSKKSTSSVHRIKKF